MKASLHIWQVKSGFNYIMSKLQDLTGKRFERLVVVERTANNKRQPVWICKCDCGNYTKVQSSNLKSGNVRSCGCLAKEIKPSLTHGLHGTRLYEIWHGMKQRCYLPTVKPYKNYGGRGIKVCDEWKNDFMSFYNWAITNGYREYLTLDRIDNDGNYEPNNCRWITRKEQSNNKRTNRYITYNGKTHTLSQWCEILGVKRHILKYRLNHWGIDRAFEDIIATNKKIK